MTEQTPSGISRRTLAKGAAWSVPAVAVAAAAPAYAQSVPCVPVLDEVNSCKNAKADQYKLVFTLSGSNCGACTLEIRRVYEATGQGRTIWAGVATGGTPIYVCEPYNMSNYIMIEARINCPGDEGTWQSYKVRMPQLTSSNCTTEEWAANCPS